MYTFLPSNTKELFNNISFILLITLGFLAMVSINIALENKILHQAISDLKLEITQEALKFFETIPQTQHNIEEFYKTIEGVKLANLYDKENNLIFSNQEAIEQSFYKDTTDLNELLSLKPYHKKEIAIAISLNAGETLFITAHLPKEVINTIWQHQIITLVSIIITMVIIYTTYRLLLIFHIMKDVDMFLKGFGK